MIQSLRSEAAIQNSNRSGSRRGRGRRGGPGRRARRRPRVEAAAEKKLAAAVSCVEPTRVSDLIGEKEEVSVPGAKPEQQAEDVSAPGEEPGRKSGYGSRLPRIPKRLDELTEEQRQALAQDLGYRKIGKEVPEDVSVAQIVRTFPEEVYVLDHWKAWRGLLVTLTSMGLAFSFVALAPWYLLPLAWFLAGTASTGLFVIGHDCGHRIFHKNRLVNDVVGHFVMTPLIYPYEPWRIIHNLHHLHTNKLNKDTGWHPITIESAEAGGPPFMVALKAFLGTPLKLWLSILHWLGHHFDPSNYTDYQRKKVYLSWGIVIAYVSTVWPALVMNLGWWGWVKFWLMPWMGYHFWMSTFTLVHHTAPHIPFREEGEWHAAQAKLGGTVHCDFPKWVEVLCHDINVHVPHHLSARIPWYHLRAATDSLRENWGEYMTECNINWRMMRNFFTEIHLYAEDESYVSFDREDKEAWFLKVQRKLYPDTMN